MWRSKGRLNFPVNGLVFYAPLWHPQNSGSPFNALDLVTPGTHSCTVTGATWGSQGRTFDGIDDVISIPAAASINNLAAITIIVWMNPTLMLGNIVDKGSDASVGVNGWLLRMSTLGRVVFNMDYATTNLNVVSAQSIITLSTWQQVALVWNGSADASLVKIYVNGALTTNSGTTDGVGARVDDSASSLLLGNDAALAQDWKGIQGDVLIYNRALTQAELSRVYQSTRWRYL